MREGPEAATLPAGTAGAARAVRLARPAREAAIHVALAVAAALLALAISGFRLSSNNVFHIPYVLGLPAQPEFAGDEFYGSLRFFVSVVWPALRLVATEADLQALFLAAHVIGAALFFGGLIYLLRVIGLSSRLAVATCLCVLALTPWLREPSVVGDHDMLPYFLTHTTFSWPLAFLALGLLQRRRYAASAAAIGGAFCVNAVVGIWLGFVLAFVVAFDRAARAPRRLAQVLLAFLVPASPALVWIGAGMLAAAQAGDPASFGSYRDFIRLYYPAHFLIEAAHALGLGALAWLYAVGCLAALHLSAARLWLRVQAACLLLFLVGIPLPYLFDSPLAFNLHLLRSDGLEQAIAVILAAAVGATMLWRAESPLRQLAGVVILFSLATVHLGIDLVPIAFALAATLPRAAPGANAGARLYAWLAAACERHARVLMALCLITLVLAAIYQFTRASLWFAPAVRLVLAAAVVALLGWLGRGEGRRMPAIAEPRALLASVALLSLGTASAVSLQRLQQPPPVQIAESAPASGPLERSWRQMMRWIRTSDAHGVFLIPVSSPAFRPQLDWLNHFQLQARRPVWVDWKQGAAAMWWPPFRRQWVARYREVLALATPGDFVAYARDKGIENVLIETRAHACPPPARLIKATEHYSFCRLPARRAGTGAGP